MINTNIDIAANITPNLVFGGFITIILLVAAALYTLNKDPNNDFSWLHLVQDPVTQHGSLAKVLQLIGGLTGTFIVVFQTMSKVLTAEMFMIYLGALGVSEAFSKWASLKYASQLTPKTEETK